MQKLLITYIILNSFYPLYSQNWNNLGNGLDGNGVFALYKSTDGLYISGGIHADTLLINGISKWNDTSWFSLDNGFEYGSIKAIINYNNKIYAGGQFQRFLGSFTVRNLAVWNGVYWDKVGEPEIGNTVAGVRALATYKQNLYAGGVFTTIGSTTYQRIARWDGSQWHDVGGGIAGGVPSPGPYCMIEYNNELIVGGRFGGSYNGVYSENIIKWDGIQWKTFDYGLDGAVFDMVVDTVDNVLYVCGIFYSSVSTGLPCKFVAGWNGYEWFSLGNTTDNYHGMNSGIKSLAIYNNYLFAGGGSGSASIADTALACWDGSSWEPVSGRPNTDVNALAVYNGKLYVGGYFTQVGTDTSIKYIASYYDTVQGHLSTGIAKNQLSNNNNQLIIYPNPTTNIFTIETNLTQGSKGNIKIFGIKGELKLEIPIESEKYSTIIDVSRWKKGVYFCNLKTGNKEEISKKFVVQ